MSLKMRKRRVTVVMPETRMGRVKAQAVRAADRVGPMASSARDMAMSARDLASSAREGTYSRIEEVRLWAAPRLDQAAHTVEDQLAPRLSSMLSQAARRVDPAPMPVRGRGMWPMMVFLGGLALGAVGFLMYRRNARHWADVMKESAEESRQQAEEMSRPMTK
ncbi:hypothetical protein [Acrocarpospora catenulata]|uniref:hypothetical protein n=1 Tax=Acrocarpospora catenulata TaxID=2836182 RepID=UPI001BDA616A|nr:hypothetical protein [Acrocarpospora catenulata]